MNQKRVTLNKGDWLMVNIGKFENCSLSGNILSVLYGYGGHVKGIDVVMDNDVNDWELPEGSYTLYGKGSEITEDQWRGIVESGWWYDGPQERHGLGKVTYYREYPKELGDSCFLSAKESGHSWIISNGFEPGKVVILKINKS